MLIPTPTSRPRDRILLLAVLVLLGGLLTALPAEEDPRPTLVRLQSDGLLEEALARVDALLDESPQLAARLGLPYLRADLLERLGRPRAASQAFALAIGESPELAAHARLRIARLQVEGGHPEVAAGVAATLLGSSPPPSIVEPTARLLVDSIEGGGDCRLLRGLIERRFERSIERELSLAAAECELREGRVDDAADRLRRVLEESVDDRVSWLAADRLVDGVGRPLDAEERLLVGLAFHRHRDFDRAQRYLGPLVPDGRGTLDREGGELAYDFARADFWLGRYETAAGRYAELAERIPFADQSARARYQRGRSLELGGDWRRAIEAYLDCYRFQPQGNFAGPALIGALRLAARLGDLEAALRLYEVLQSRRGWRYEASRAALFLASSELVLDRQHDDGPGRWLREAADYRPSRLEVSYWRGRHAQVHDEPAEAVRHYADVLAADPYHPLAEIVRRKLEDPELEAATRNWTVRLARSSDSGELLRAWLLGGDERSSRDARIALLGRLTVSPVSRSYLETTPAPIAEWPIWQTAPRGPEDRLLGLGLWQEGESAVLEHFPVARPPLALAAAEQLAAAGEIRRSLLLAEILTKRTPSEVPEPLLASSVRRALYPAPWRELYFSAGARHGVEPWLLMAISREESRFDPDALSKAGARGLMQLILPTAREVAGDLGLPPPEPDDLHRPEISIELGAAYLARLLARYEGRIHQVVAAYNAGETQAELWQSHCLSLDPAEYFSKIAFPETRAYVERVLRSRAHYRELDRRQPPRRVAEGP